MLKETKNKFQDIKPIKRKDIRQKKTIFKKQSFEKDIAKEEKNNTPKFTIWIIALISIIFLLFALSSLFSGATVTISPKSVNLTLSNSFDAFKNPTNDNLSFEVMVIEREKEKLTPITDTKVVERKATGRVIIYNTFDNNPQKLLIDTRLESPDGRIYKTDSPITVPGMKIVNDQSIPGSVEVGIYADEPGSEYNIGLSDFTIIGFKGSSKYEKFYGRSKTEVKGGLVGNINFINEEKAKQTQLEIRDILQKELLNQAKAQIPDGFVSYNNAIFLNFNDSDNSFFESENNSITIKESGSIQVILFNEAELSKTIARNTIDNFDESDVFIPDISGLGFSINDPDQLNPKEAQQINFSITGPVKIIWVVDKEKLIKDLIDKRKRNFESILGKHPNIINAEAIVKPFWKRTFPEKARDIEIVTLNN